MTASLTHRIDAAIDALAPSLVSLRRHLHANPEVGWAEIETQAHLAAWLARHGVETRACAGTGLIADLGAGAPRTLYRGDIDALPIAERKPAGCEYVSTRQGASHACGHDVHSTIACAVAVVASGLGEALPHPVRVVLQPAEEVVPSGAERMVAEGALDAVARAFALHVDPARDIGRVGVRVGPLTSAVDSFVIDVTGVAGHSARPHLARDAILAAADIVRAVYALTSQRVPSHSPSVVNVGLVSAGEARNVIAGRARLEGVARSLEPETRALLQAELPIVVSAAAAVYGCQATTTFAFGAPPVVNDGELHTHVVHSAREVIGVDGVEWIDHPSAGAEDFGVFGRHVPQYMFRLGVRTPGGPTTHLHTPEFDVDEASLVIGARIACRATLTAPRQT